MLGRGVCERPSLVLQADTRGNACSRWVQGGVHAWLWVGKLPGEHGEDWVAEEEGRAVGWAGCPKRKGTDVQTEPLDTEGLRVQEGDSRRG